MTAQDPGWKESVDGVVSDFGEVTRHLRRRQEQALRVAWTVTGACAVAIGALIFTNLPPGVPRVDPGSPQVALLSPSAEPGPLYPSFGGVLPPNAFDTQPPAQPPAQPAPASAPTTPHRTAPVPAHPAPAPAATAPVTSQPVEVSVPPAATTPPDAPAQPGVVDGLVKGVLHLLS